MSEFFRIFPIAPHSKVSIQDDPFTPVFMQPLQNMLVLTYICVSPFFFSVKAKNFTGQNSTQFHLIKHISFLQEG